MDANATPPRDSLVKLTKSDGQCAIGYFDEVLGDQLMIRPLDQSGGRIGFHLPDIIRIELYHGDSGSVGVGKTFEAGD